MFEIKVVDRDDEKLFECTEGGRSLLFNKLAAQSLLGRGSLKVLSEGETLERTFDISYGGGPDYALSFLDASGDSTPMLAAADYSVGDVIKLDVPEGNDPLIGRISNHFVFTVRVIEMYQNDKSLRKADPENVIRAAYAAPLPDVLRYK